MVHLLKKNTLISTKKCRNTKRFLKISMIKNLAPLTYNKSFWLRHDDLSYNCFLRYYSNRIVAIEKNEKTAKKNQVFYQAICTVFTHLIALQSPNISKQKTVPCNSLRWSKRKKRWREVRIETNQSWNDKVSWEVRGLFVFSAGSFVFLLQCYWFVYKKVWHPLFSINMFIGSFFFISIRFK